MLLAIAYATAGPGEPFHKRTIARRALGARDVLIGIRYAGICHSDIHAGHAEPGDMHFPLVPGHEIAGVVEAVGEQVTKHAIGDRVGVGCMVGSCGGCQPCRAGEEQYCEQMIGTYGSLDRDGTWTAGGYSSHIVVDEHFVLRIPADIPLECAAPLLCAGITVYSPLRRWHVGEGVRVGIVGLGGLGHMGVKLARAMGAEVTVFDRTGTKAQSASALGAAHYVTVGDASEFERLVESFDLIISTAPSAIDMIAYLRMLALDGTLVSVGTSSKPQRVFPSDLIRMRRGWVGSMIGGVAETQEMLDFCATHGFGADVELVRGDQIDAAWERVIAGDVRYRFVVDIATF